MTIEQATQLCIEAHKGQFRKDGITPYHTHPIAVAELLDTTNEKIAALLHDILEDTKVTYEDLVIAGVPPRALSAILILTKEFGIPYTQYLQGISNNTLATKVKIADMFHNVSDTPSTQQVKKYTNGIKILLASL